MSKRATAAGRRKKATENAEPSWMTIEQVRRASSRRTASGRVICVSAVPTWRSWQTVSRQSGATDETHRLRRLADPAAGERLDRTELPHPPIGEPPVKITVRFRALDSDPLKVPRPYFIDLDPEYNDIVAAALMTGGEPGCGGLIGLTPTPDAPDDFEDTAQWFGVSNIIEAALAARQTLTDADGGTAILAADQAGWYAAVDAPDLGPSSTLMRVDRIEATL